MLQVMPVLFCRQFLWTKQSVQRNETSREPRLHASYKNQENNKCGRFSCSIKTMIKIMFNNYCHQKVTLAVRVVLQELKIYFMETMETTELTRIRVPKNEMTEEEFDAGFKPKGAIAFFILLLVLGGIIWYGIYFIMLSRV
jgi:hypothetical protein